MTLQSSMFSGISGLSAAGTAMSVIGNNIANANTIGFKSGRALFADLVSAKAAGVSNNSSQIGRGVRPSTVDNIFSQGTFENTESNTDLAIEGDGFFIARQAGNAANFYTRAGGFKFDEDGYLVNPTGMRVQGFALDADGNTTGDITDIQVATALNATPVASDEVTLEANLNADAIVGPVFDETTPTTTSNFAISSTVFDSLGASHVLTTYFTKTAANAWDANVCVDDAEFGVVPPANALQIVGTQAMTFNPDGSLLTPAAPGTFTTTAAALTWGNGSAQDQQLTYTIADMTQYANISNVSSQQVNGNGAGSLAGLSIDNDGNVIVTHTTGQPTAEFRLALARFQNPHGLAKQGDNMYSSTDNSGNPIIGTPGSGVGKIFTFSLEQSNVDLAQEFVRMITTQRTFQANSRIITTTDEMLAELINLKR